MDEFDPHLTIKKFSEAKDSSIYTNKEIELDTSKPTIDTPLKIIEGKKINQSDIVGGEGKNFIFESGVFVDQYRNWKSLYTTLEEAGKEKISKLDRTFGLKKNLWDSNQTTLSHVFSKNPLIGNDFYTIDKETKKRKKVRLPPLSIDAYEELLDYIHSASSSLILSPDIKMEKENIITTTDYIDFVDQSVNILSTWNNKPIFVPIQIDLQLKQKMRILEHYKTKGYTNIWINFKGSHIGASYFARVRNLIRQINKKFGLKNVVLYSSHIKKEVGTDINSNILAGSNIMSQFFSSDFIGIERETRKWVKSSEEDRKEYLVKKGFRTEDEYKQASYIHKNRIFDGDSYYYYKLDHFPNLDGIDKNFVMKNRENNRLVNSLLLYAEVENTKNFVDNNKIIKPYLKKKKLFNDDKKLLNNVIVEKVRKKKGQKDIFDFLSEV